MATVLLYHMTEQKEAQLRFVCRTLKINVRTVMDSELHLPIGALVGRSVSGGDKLSGGIDGEMLLMADFSPELLDRFLQTCRLSGVEQVPLKAVLTEYNQTWSSVALQRELIREHTQMQKKLRRK